jgi:hypothetical protein
LGFLLSSIITSFSIYFDPFNLYLSLALVLLLVILLIAMDFTGFTGFAEFKLAVKKGNKGM